MKNQPPNDTKRSILDAAETLILTRGYNGFSYQDISAVVGIRKASIHHHFPSKENLGTAFVDRYFARFQSWSNHVADLSADRKLASLLQLFKQVSDNADKICPMGMLTAEYPTLPQSVQNALCRLLSEMDDWLVQVLVQGQAENLFVAEPQAPVLAKVIMNSMSASMKTARIFHDIDQLDMVFNALIKMIRIPEKETP